jgi:hypothetical protein
MLCLMFIMISCSPIPEPSTQEESIKMDQAIALMTQIAIDEMTPTPTITLPDLNLYLIVVTEYVNPKIIAFTLFPRKYVKTIYIIQNTYDASPDPLSIKSAPVYIQEDFQKGISEELIKLQYNVIWVEFFDQVERDPDSGVVLSDGAIITFGNIHYESPTKALLAISYYCAPLGAGGMTYILEKVDNIWKITDTTHTFWQS